MFLLIKIVNVDLNKDLNERDGEAENHPNIHQLDIGGSGQRIRNTDEPVKKFYRVIVISTVICIEYIHCYKDKHSSEFYSHSTGEILILHVQGCMAWGNKVITGGSSCGLTYQLC